MRYRRMVAGWAKAVLLFAVLVACVAAQQTAPRVARTAFGRLKTQPVSVQRKLYVPAAPGPLAPAMTRAGAAASGAALAADEQLCGGCHAEVVAEWRGSAHAAASLDNPIYRVSLEGFRAARGARASRLCGGCHDPALLIDGLMDVPELPVRDARAQVGVSCRSCHGAVAASVAGNGSYTLAGAAFAEADVPSVNEPASIARHRAVMVGPTLANDTMCIACHRSLLGMFSGHNAQLRGMDEGSDWARSAYAGSELERIDEVPRRSCRDCHMPPEPAPKSSLRKRMRRSHRFAGGHSWLAAMNRDPAQAEAVARQLMGAVELDVVLLDERGGLVVDGAASQVAMIDVVMTNAGVGHRFPGGTRDAQDSWLDVELRDLGGRRIAQAGIDADPGRHRLHAQPVDAEGQPVPPREVELLAAVAYDTSIAPRDSVVVRYQLPRRLPSGTLKVRLRHRSRALSLQQRACNAQLPADNRDSCQPQPLTTIAATVVDLRPERPQPRALLRHGRAWLHALGEDVLQAQPSLLRAYNQAQGDRLQAAAALELGRLAALQGRGEALEHWLASAQLLAPSSPAPAWWRVQYLQSSWRSRQTLPALERLALDTPRDDRPWRRLATASGVTGDGERSLEQLQIGLLLRPRDSDLLRLQWQALRSRAMPAAARPLAQLLFLLNRGLDDGRWLSARCGLRDETCARERLPVHVHQLQLAH